MLIDEFFAPKILIVSGKGGVGKTTIAASLALLAARHGHTVCLAAVDAKGAMPQLFGFDRALTYEPREMSPGVWGMNIVAEEALAEYLDVQYHMKRISRVFTSSHFLDYIATAAPGLKDVLVLGKVWYLEQGRANERFSHRFDTIIVDAPAAGHMLTFLSAPMGLSDALRVGPVKRQAEWLVEMLRDPNRARVHLVTLPEEMPVTETIETAQNLDAAIGVAQGAVFANAVYAEVLTPNEEQEIERLVNDGGDELRAEAEAVGLSLDPEDVDELLAYGRFVTARRAIQTAHLRNLRDAIDEPVVELPFIFSAGLQLPDIDNLADVIEEEVAKL